MTIHISDTDLSDFHKDAFGFRPRGTYKEWWTKAELEAEYDYLSGVCRDNGEMEEIRQAENLIEFETLIKETIANGAGDRETAIRWLFDAEDLTFSHQDIEHFFWTHGLSWGKIDEFKKEFKKVLDVCHVHNIVEQHLEKYENNA